jgi:eukaryotic-like serine/threonine-protein kinase
MIGTTVSHYKILEKLGGGGMGVVYKAEDTKLKRTVALKFLPPELTRDEEAKERFTHEAQAASALDHNNICTVHEIAETEEGQMFIAMACYDGETLKSRIGKGRMRTEEAIDFAIQIAQGLAEAHQHGIVHRDIKPANILRTTSGVVKIVDFGLAKLSGRAMLTRAGSTVGTAAYMSPEQASGGQVDHRTDIWSLGVVLYQMLTGELPFKSDYEQALIYSILNDAPEPVTSIRSEIPAKIEEIVQKAIAKRLEDRYQSINEMISDLRSAVQTEPALRRSATLPRAGRKRLLAIGALLVVVAIAAFFLFRPTGAREVHKLAILPFVDTSRDSTLGYLYDGLTEDVIRGVSRAAKTMKVLSFNGVVNYRSKEIDPPTVGKELGVDAIAICRDYRRGNDHDFRFEIVDVNENTQIWSEAYRSSADDIAGLPNKMAAGVVKALGSVVAGEALASGGQPVQNLDAWRLYQKGNSHYHRLAEAELRLAIQFFKKALEIEPRYALAHAGIALSYYQLSGEAYTRETRDSSLNEAIKALELDAKLPEAHLAIACVKYLNLELLEASKEFERAIELNPSYADAFHMYAHWQAERREFDKGLEMMRRSIELEPMNAHFQFCLGFTYLEARKWDDAIAAMQKATEIDSTWAVSMTRQWLAECHRAKGDFQKASEYYRLVVSAKDTPDLWREFSGFELDICDGRLDNARKRIATMLAIYKRFGEDPWPIACAYAMLKDGEQTLKWATRMYEVRSAFFPWLNVFQDFDFLRDDPRFEALMKKAGFRD